VWNCETSTCCFRKRTINVSAVVCAPGVAIWKWKIDEDVRILFFQYVFFADGWIIVVVIPILVLQRCAASAECRLRRAVQALNILEMTALR
jgi:hypothetical protein